MTGFQEILVVVAIVVGLLFLPRLRSAGRRVSAPVRKFEISGKMRLALAVSVLYPAVAAAVLQPWKSDLTRYLYVGLGPVAVGWLAVWVWTGFRHRHPS